MTDFLLGKKYDIDYFYAISSVKLGKKVFLKEKTSAKNLMYCRQTMCFYIFWTGTNYFKLKKTNLIKAIVL